MDAILVEIYSTWGGGGPYVIGAYALLGAVLFAFVFAVMRGVRRAEQQMAVIEEELEERDKRSTHEL